MKSLLRHAALAATVATIVVASGTALAQPIAVARPQLAGATPPPRSVQITHDQVHAFGTKLDAFRNSLAPQERRIMDGIVKRAGSRPAEDVSKPVPRTSA